MPGKYVIDVNILKRIADAIRLKTGDTSLIAVKDFPAKISAITTGTAEITSEIDELGNVRIYGLNSFNYENENVIIS